MHKKLFAFLICSVLLGAPSSWAQNQSGPEGTETETPRELIGDAAQRLVRALELILMAIPQYSAPELLENGDIIIKRKWPEGETPVPMPPEQPRTLSAPERKI
ncbi:MAG: hypothetical protein OQJ97_00805 [Rhodospirillales bacterium]|nr:hypothetical protein [Rhodospirillales bacterium]